jgi:divalent metal cation (Fe/Co/Zn/Cd) transporter
VDKKEIPMTKDSCCTELCGSNSNFKPDPKWLKIAFALVSLTIVYNVLEAVLAVWTGEKAESIALVGFGVDSLIEVSAAFLMLWRLIEQVRHHNDEVVERAENRVHRFVGVSFFLLAAYIAFNAISTLWHQTRPEQSLFGIILALLSLIIMPLLSWGKMRAAHHIQSNALTAEAKESIACSILSFILLVGLVANATLGWWWADPVAGLVMLPWLLKEGIAGIKGEGCCG